MLQQGLDGVRRRVRGRRAAAGAPTTPTGVRPRRRSCSPTSTTRASSASPSSDPTARSSQLVEKPARPAVRPRARRRLPVRPAHPRRGARDRAVGARRARDHRRHPVADRPRATACATRCSRAGGSTPARRTRCSRATGSCSRRSSRGSTARSTTRSPIEGRVVIEAGAEIVQLHASAVRRSSAPARASSNSYVGPFTSIAADCEIVDSEIEHSVVLEHSRHRRRPPPHRLAHRQHVEVVAVRRSTPAGHPADARRPLAIDWSSRLMADDHASPTSSPASTSSSPTIHGDERGIFIETYRREWFPQGREMIQGNRGDRQAGAVVGLHYHLHQADYWYVPDGQRAGRAARPPRRLAHRRRHAHHRPRRAAPTAPTTTAACSSRPASRTGSPRSPT